MTSDVNSKKIHEELERETLPPKDDGREYVVVVANVMQESAKICSLWRTGLIATHSFEAKFDWYYQRNPGGPPDVLFLQHGNAVDAVGIAAVGHRAMRFCNSMLLTGVLVDLVVRPEHRTLFPALFLQKEMRRRALQTHSIVWGLPNPRATAVIRRAGYQCVGQMVRYVRVLRSAGYLARHLPRWLSCAVGPIIDQLRLGAILLRGIGKHGYITHWQNRPDARFNDLWKRSAKPDQLMGVRDEQYLTWRFVRSQFQAHSFLTLVSAVDQRLIGYAACEILQQGLHVSDFLVDTTAQGASACLWLELSREAFRKGCRSVFAEFLGSEVVQRELKNAGLIAREQSSLYAAFADPSRPLSEKHWYLTCADVDG